MQMVESYLEKGDSLRAEGKWKEALECYQKVTELEPENWLAYHHFGDAMLNLKQFRNAEIAYRQAIQYNSDFLWAYHNLGVALRNLEKWDEAFQCFTRVTKLNPNFWEMNQIHCRVHQDLADYLFEQQRWDDALIVYDWVTQLQPNFAWGHINLGRTLQQVKQFAQARNALRRGIDLAPEIPWGYYYLGKLLSEQEKYTQAIEIYYLGLSRHPRETQLYIALGEAQEAIEDFASQIETYKTLITENSEQDISVYLSLAYSLHQAERLEEAVEVYERTAKAYPNFWLIYYYLGKTFYITENWINAAENLEKAASLQPDFFDIYVLLGDCLANLGEIHESMEAYETARKINPKLDLISKIEALSKQFTHLGGYEIHENNQENRQVNVDHVSETEDNEVYVKSQMYSKFLEDHEIYMNEAVYVNDDDDDDVYINDHEDNEVYGDDEHEDEVLDHQMYSYSLQEQMIFAELDDSEFVKQMFQYLLGRQPNQNELYSFLKNYENGCLTRASTLEDIIKSEEFFKTEDSEEILLPELNNQDFVEYLYQIFLKRTAEPEAIEGNCTALENGISRITLLHTFLESEEFLSLENQTLVEEISDHEFLHTIWQILLDGPCDAHSEKHYLNRLEFGLSRLSLVSEIMKTDTFKNRIKRFNSLEKNQSSSNSGGGSQNSAMVLGTGKFIDQDQWNNILLDVLLDRNSINHDIDNLSFKVSSSSPEKTKDSPIASIITSLYKGQDYINYFMENITSQTIFSECELIIIDANSPEGEYEVIEKYMDLFENIKYTRLDEVIGIYDAWNLGIQNSKGQFLTNANLDDLRRADCLEKQVNALKKHEDVDIVYQDFYYTFTPNLPFEVIAKCGVQSKLPILTKANMLQFNSPHNAPMWRRAVHDKIGLFNTRYKSAGDYEFWLRALLHGSQFYKVEEPLVAYYNNPFGISTRSQGAATNEVIEIQGLYLKLFGHSFFSMPKEDFIDFCCTNLKLTGELANVPSLEKWQGKDVFLYQCFDQKLKKISSSKFYLPLAD